MATITLDQLRADIEAKYGPFEIDLGGEKKPVVLQPLLRLPKEKRATFTELQAELKAVQGDDADLDGIVEVLHKIFRLIADSPAAADQLIAAMPDEPAFALELFEQWAAAAMPGEASPSQS